MLNVLQKVLDEAHLQHTYIPDKEQYGKTEYWTKGLQGDCEDFALWVRDRLKQEDISSNLIFCKTEDNVGHLVVSVDGWILDNRYTFVMNRNDLNYTWIKLGTPEGTWYKIKG